MQAWGHPLAGRSQARTLYPPAVFLMADFLCTTVLHPALLFQIESVSSMLAATESRLSPIWIKQNAMNRLRPGGTPPQRNLGAAEVSGQRSRMWLALARPVPNWLTRQTTRYNNTATTQAVTARPPLRPLGSCGNLGALPFAGLPWRSARQCFYLHLGIILACLR